MASGDSIVSICNSALIALGEDLITSISPPDQTKRAILLAERYDPVRRSVLRNFPYKCAKQATTLALSTYVPPVTWDYAYSLPADCLRFYDLPDNDGAHWEIGQDAMAGGLLLTDEAPPLSGVYIRDLTDPTRFDPMLVDVLALELAIDLCEAITGSTTKLQGLRQRLAEKMGNAQLADSDQQSSDEWDDDVWLRSRR